MKLRLWRDSQSRQVAECAAELVHGVAGTKAVERYDLLVVDFETQLGDSQDFGRGPLLAGEKEHTDKLGVGEACGTDDVAVSEVRHLAVTNSKNSVFRIAFIDKDVFDMFHITGFNKGLKAQPPLRSGRAGERD